MSDDGEVFELGSGEDRVQELGSNEGGIKVQVSDGVGVQGLEGESSDVHLSPLFSPSPESPSPLWATEEPYARAESPASSLLKSPASSPLPSPHRPKASKSPGRGATRQHRVSFSDTVSVIF